MNGQTADQDETPVKEAYGQNRERLAGIKAAYDAWEPLRSNRNIGPLRLRPPPRSELRR